MTHKWLNMERNIVKVIFTWSWTGNFPATWQPWVFPNKKILHRNWQVCEISKKRRRWQLKGLIGRCQACARPLTLSASEVLHYSWPCGLTSITKAGVFKERISLCCNMYMTNASSYYYYYSSENGYSTLFMFGTSTKATRLASSTDHY